jgi:hypothetical protein
MPKQATLADIEKSYDEALKKVANNPEAATEIKIERATAIAEFKLKVVAEREKALWTREALTEFPLARGFSDQVVGDTEDAIRASAKALHERIETLFGEHQKKLEIDRLIQEHMNGSQPEAQDDAAATETV